MGRVIKELLSGRVKMAVWENEDNKGRKWHSITLARIYKDEKDEWQKASAFRDRDLLDIATLSNKAHDMLRVKENVPVISESKPTESETDVIRKKDSDITSKRVADQKEKPAHR